MLTISLYFRIRKHELFNYETGYIERNMDIDTTNNPKILDSIHKLPEITRVGLVEMLDLKDSDVEIISRSEYNDETEED